MTTNEVNQCGDATDVQFRQANLAGFRGYWQCLDRRANKVCGKFLVTINRAAIANNGGPFALNVRKTACHDLGHTVGMDHHDRYGDCQVSGPVESGHVSYNYNPHGRHVDDYFE